MKPIPFLIVCAVFISGCTKNFDARKSLTSREYDSLLIRIAPYVIKKPDAFLYEDRFAYRNRSFYQNSIDLIDAEISHYYVTDTATLFFFRHRDLTSMQEHYRGLGGYFRLNENGEITFLNLLYHTPRLGKAQMDNRSLMLFEEMVKTGNVKAYLGNRSFIHSPNNDFFYDAERSRWANTARSAWKFLDEAKN